MRNGLTASLAFFFVSVLAVGCTSKTVDDPEEGVATLELGTGSWRFEPLEDGQQVDMIRGAQGGWHVWLSLRAHGVETQSAMFEVETQVADESKPPHLSQTPIRFENPDDAGMRKYIGWPEILVDPACMAGQMLRIRASVSDDDGMHLTSERYIIAMGGADPPPACAQ